MDHSSLCPQETPSLGKRTVNERSMQRRALLAPQLRQEGTVRQYLNQSYPAERIELCPGVLGKAFTANGPLIWFSGMNGSLLQEAKMEKGV